MITLPMLADFCWISVGAVSGAFPVKTGFKIEIMLFLAKYSLGVDTPIFSLQLLTIGFGVSFNVDVHNL